MTTWHVDDAALERWTDGTDGAVQGASVEQHLLSCAQCRGKVAVDPVVSQVWSQVQHVLEVPRQSLLERLLLRAGLAQADARIVAVSPAFRGAWIIGLTALLTFVTVAGGIEGVRGQRLFLLIAPLVPALAVALGYDAELDEALETECATPYSRVRVVLLRSAALLIVALPSFVAASLVLPGPIAFWWLLPAAGCTALVLALSTWVSSLTAVGVVGTAWMLLLAGTIRGGAASDVLDGAWLLAYAVVCAVGVLLVVLRRGHLAWEVR